MILRTHALARVLRLLRDFPIVAILGARQVGKTTLARQVIAKRGGRRISTFDLEDPADLGRLREPMLALRDLRGLIVVDEVQRRRDLFSILRVLADRRPIVARFLILGSASPDLLRQSAESLAGRIAFVQLPGLDLEEVGVRQLERLWLRGGFPRSFLASSLATSAEWRRNFIATFLERDLPQLGIGVPSGTMHRFWTMLAHWHGQVWNASEFGRSFAVSDVTARRYLEHLAATFVVRTLQPWSANLGKRQVRSPKVYVTDSGLLHSLLGLRDRRDIERHPKLGASWEGFAIEQVIARMEARPDQTFFWATHSGAELDLLIVDGRKRCGFEIKRTDSPEVTKSMRIAIADLGLTSLDVIHAGERTYPLAKNIRAVAARRIFEDVSPLGR